MKTFKEVMEGVSTSKYSKLWKKIDKSNLFNKKDKKKVYELVVDEYLDAGDDPNVATEQDAAEVADASGIDIAEGTKAEYQAFFNKKLSKYGVKSPSELSTADKKKFYDEIEKEWTKDEEVQLSEAKSLEFVDEDDNYIIASFDYEGKDYQIMARGKDWKYAWEVYEGEDDDEVYDSSGRNYKDMVNKIGKWVKKFTKGKFDIRGFPKEKELEKMVSHGPKYDD